MTTTTALTDRERLQIAQNVKYEKLSVIETIALVEKMVLSSPPIVTESYTYDSVQELINDVVSLRAVAKDFYNKTRDAIVHAGEHLRHILTFSTTYMDSLKLPINDPTERPRQTP